MSQADPSEGECLKEGNRAIPVLGGTPLHCLDVAGLVVDVTLMTPRGCNTKHAEGVVDAGDPNAIEERYARYRAASDVAQVVANYLRCHPRVEEVRYPGLKGDPSFAVAARTLVGGFGPWVDYRSDGTWHRVTCEPEDPKVAVMRLERELATTMPRT